jgi:zinc-finger binding domain of transposase IS66
VGIGARVVSSGQRTRVDQIVDHFPDACGGCGRVFTPQEQRPRRRFGRHQVAELPPISVIVTEHRTHRLRCRSCRSRTSARLPEKIGASAFGPRLQAAAVTLTARHRISRRGSQSPLATWSASRSRPAARPRSAAALQTNTSTATDHKPSSHRSKPSYGSCSKRPHPGTAAVRDQPTQGLARALDLHHDRGGRADEQPRRTRGPAARSSTAESRSASKATMGNGSLSALYLLLRPATVTGARKAGSRPLPRQYSLSCDRLSRLRRWASRFEA